ncbi:MAG: methanogenesis marker protein 11 [Candidatus Levyibacteriota bacterium]
MQPKTKIFTPQQLRTLLKDKKWIMEYNALYGIVDSTAKKVMYIENYGPPDGFFIEGWRALHFPNTSPLVEKSYREGGSTIFILNEGKANLNLVPSFAPIGIEECQVKNNEVRITIAGFGGGGVSASFSRGMAKGVKQIEVLDEGGGTKYGRGLLVLPAKHMLLIGIDDTDNNEEGATYSLAHNIATDIAKKYNVVYAIHNNIQLYPYNPNKTKNCMSTVIGFIFEDIKKRDRIVKEFAKQLKKYTVSQETGMAVFDGFTIPEELTKACLSVKYTLIKDIDALKDIAKRNGVELHTITGERGLIGAIAALGFYDNPELASKLPEK